MNVAQGKGVSAATLGYGTQIFLERAEHATMTVVGGRAASEILSWLATVGRARPHCQGASLEDVLSLVRGNTLVPVGDAR